jgi:hypothetical protein
MQSKDRQFENKDSNGARGKREKLAAATRTPFRRSTQGIVGIVFVIGIAWLILSPRTPDPAIQPMPAGEQEGYRVVARRATPPSATALSEEFVPVEGRLRESILQRLSEFKATWRVGDPEIYLNSSDVNGDGIAFARQLEGWLEQYGLVRGPAISPDLEASAGGSGGGDAGSSTAGGAKVKDGRLPAPQVRGFVIRCREADSAMARDLALALLPAIGGESSILFDERTGKNRLVVSMTGSPSFGESGIAYFPAT